MFFNCNININYLSPDGRIQSIRNTLIVLSCLTDPKVQYIRYTYEDIPTRFTFERCDLYLYQKGYWVHVISIQVIHV